MESRRTFLESRALTTAPGSAQLALDDSATPLITVIIPTYNRSAALLKCLQHLEQQTFKKFNVIVSDDGSTDDTPTLLKRYCATTPLRLHCLRQPNAGPARARNAAIAQATTPICLMIGDDIFASPAFVAEHLHFHQQHPEPRAAALGVTQWAEQGQTITPFMRWLDVSELQFSYISLLAGRAPGWGDFFTSNLSLKTAVLRENPFNEIFPGAAMEDIELGYRLHRSRGLDVHLLPAAFAAHFHPTTFTQACRRMQGVGLANRLFQTLWPEFTEPESKGMRRWLAAFLRRPVPLAMTTALARFATRLYCPNPLMKYCLRLHVSVGFRSPRAVDLARLATSSPGSPLAPLS